MPTYAKDTTVAVNRSRDEIERTLKRYGATAFMHGWDEELRLAGVEFKMNGKRVRFQIRSPERKEFEITPTGQWRSDSTIDKAWEAGTRQRWRALALVVKAKLEAVEAGISSFEDELLASFVLPAGGTVGDWMVPQLEAAYESHEMPPMLPEARLTKEGQE